MNEASAVDGRGPDWVARQRRRCILRGAAWSMSVPVAVLLHRLVPGLAWYGPIAMVSCVLLGAAFEAWRWPRTDPADTPPMVVALTTAISVGTIVFTVDLGANHPVVYPIGAVVVAAAWLVTIAGALKASTGPAGR